MSNGKTTINLLTVAQQTFLGLQDVFKKSSKHVLKTSSVRLQRNNFSSSKNSGRRLEEVLQRRLQNILKRCRKTSSRRLGRRKIFTLNTFWRYVLKTSWRHVLKMSSRCLGDKQNIYWGYLNLKNLYVYLSNIYFTNLYLTNLRWIQNALIRTQ